MRTTLIGLGLSTLVVGLVAVPGAGAAVGDAPIVRGGWIARTWDCTSADPSVASTTQRPQSAPEQAAFGLVSHSMPVNGLGGNSTTEGFGTAQLDGTPLSRITRLDYSTIDATHPSPAAILVLQVDTDGVGGPDDTLTYRPATVSADYDHWQEWRLAGDTELRTGAGALTTISAYASEHPGAAIASGSDLRDLGVSFRTGCDPFVPGGAKLGDHWVDRLVVGLTGGAVTLYDLETAEEDPALSEATQTSQTVRGPGDAKWDSVATGGTRPAQQYAVHEPEVQTRGQGSLKFIHEAGSTQTEYFSNWGRDGYLLRDFRRLEFWTYQPASSAGNDPVQAVLRVDRRGNGYDPSQGDFVLTFSPSANGTVTPDVWQHWSTAGGTWTASEGLTATGHTLDWYIARNPDGVLAPGATPGQSGVGFAVPGGPTAQVSFLDAITLVFLERFSRQDNSYFYDLEPPSDTDRAWLSFGIEPVVEGNKGSVTTYLEAYLGPKVQKDVTVSYRTFGLTATGGEDFVATKGTLTIPAGANMVRVPVKVLGDIAREPKEVFQIRFGTPVNAETSYSSVAADILDDDTGVSLALRNSIGPHIGVDVVTRPRAKSRPVTVLGRVGSGAVRTLWSGNLTSTGELHRALGQTFRVGSKLTVWVRVSTANGSYRSVSRTIQVQ